MDTEDALKKLDEFTMVYVRMATDQLLKTTHIVSDTVKWYSMVGDAPYFVIDSANV